MFRRNICLPSSGSKHAGFFFGWFSTLKMKVMLSSKTSFHIHSTLSYNPEDSNFHIHLWKPQILLLTFAHSNSRSASIWTASVSRGQSSWLQNQKSGFDSRHYHTFWEVVGLEWGPPSFVSTIEELLGRKSSSSGLEIREYDRRDPSRWPRVTLYLQKLALTLPTIGGRSVGIVRSRTQATEFSFLVLVYVH
jgi:hypothetical protein